VVVHKDMTITEQGECWVDIAKLVARQGRKATDLNNKMAGLRIH